MFAFCAKAAIVSFQLFALEDEPESSYEKYAGIKGYYYHKPTLTDRAHSDADDIRVFMGLKYNRLLSNDWLIDVDVRGIFQYRNGFNPIEEDNTAFIELKKLNLVKENLFDSPYWKAEIGRKRIVSRHSWLYDDEIEFVEFNGDSTLIDFTAFFAKWLWDGRFGAGVNALDDEQRIETSGSYYFGIETDYIWYYGHHLSLSYLYEDFDNSLVDDTLFNARSFVDTSKLNWLRFSAYGLKYFSAFKIDYWLEFAGVFGERKLAFNESVNTFDTQKMEFGKAYRLGSLWQPEKSHFSFMASLDNASGDSQFNEKSGLFVQPSIASNRRRVLGQQKRRMYGEVIAPRLSNLSILTFATAYQFSPENWIEISYYKYDQNQARKNTLEFRENIPLTGISKDIGWATDISWSQQFTNDWFVESTIGYFKAGDAFSGKLERPSGHRIYFNLIKRW